MFLTFSFALVVLLSSSTALDTISANQAIKDGNTIVSLGGVFELGFFSLGDSKNCYMGIWYHNISVFTPVWVANRDNPIADISGVLKVSQEGKLIIFYGGNNKIWSSNWASWTINPIAQILDTGNLVLWDNSTSQQKLIWQSYDYPGDTVLPGMKFGKDLVTGLEWTLTSWKSPDDPSQGEYLQWMDTNGYPQMFGKKDVGVDICNRYGLCGPYGSCNINRRPLCNCLGGFEPRLPDEWEASDWSSGCQRKKPLDCKSGDGFRKISGVKLPDTRRSWYNGSMTLGECKMACSGNCSCTAYTNLDIRNGGSGCLLWFDELMDIIEYDVKQDLYIRMATSELSGNKILQFSYNKKKGVLTVVLSITSAVLLLLFAVTYTCKKKRPYMKRRGIWYALDKKNNSFQIDDIDELPFFSLYEIAKATENFSVNNKIGEGGFGPVYKGVLEGGREVAVKRLSKSSQQGIEEFKNEIACIAKLQHCNLVKLLGYCIHGNEMILIYEYMTNKSLDSFISDESRNSMLDWPQRFHIIHGIDRGILYLHQDSSLQIIHRDLKASNILLDKDMNPKISDFGLARKFVGSDTAAKTKKVVGTYGYISPEYAVHGRFSTKSDVFSFGVLVLEIVSGRKNKDFCHEDHNDNLLGHAWRLWKDNRSIELMSGSLRDSCIINEVLRAIHVGLLCVQHNEKDRPTMLSVVLMLVSESVLPEPKQPAFFTGESASEPRSVSSVDEYTLTQIFAR